MDTVCSNREMIRIAGDDYPAEVVKSRFLKIDSSHIEYVLERMRENTTDRKSTRLNSSHASKSRMPSSA